MHSATARAVKPSGVKRAVAASRPEPGDGCDRGSPDPQRPDPRVSKTRRVAGLGGDLGCVARQIRPSRTARPPSRRRPRFSVDHGSIGRACASMPFRTRTSWSGPRPRTPRLVHPAVHHLVHQQGHLPRGRPPRRGSCRARARSATSPRVVATLSAGPLASSQVERAAAGTVGHCGSLTSELRIS